MVNHPTQLRFQSLGSCEDRPAPAPVGHMNSISRYVTYQNGMQIDAVHIVPLDFVQIVQFGAGGRHSLQLLVQLRDPGFQFTALIR